MITKTTLVRYGILGLPLAFAGLPIYVNVPHFYADVLKLDLGTLGQLLLALRLLDAISDPLIGWISDRLHIYARLIMVIATPFLIAGYALLFSPLKWGIHHPIAWLGGCLFLVYLSLSALMINYYARGVDLANSYHDHTRIAGFRESFMLVGVLLASLLPTLLEHYMAVPKAYALFGYLLAPLMVVCATYNLSSPIPERPISEKGTPPPLMALLRFVPIRWVLLIGFFNAVPTAITSTLFLFFTQDILHAPSESGFFLAVYFLSAAAGMPLWYRLSQRYGKKHSLLAAMLMCIVCFIWASTLGAGDTLAFMIICVLTGLTLGADSILLPALLGDELMDKKQATASGYGFWNFTSKMTMAFAAGLVLPLLKFGGYHAEGINSHQGLLMLSLCYAVAPCISKLIALLLLYISPLDPKGARHG